MVLTTCAYRTALRLALALWLAVCFCGCKNGGPVARSTLSFPEGRGFVTRSVESGGTRHSFMVFVPRNYDPNRKYPTIVFLHGLFEGGSDAAKPLAAGIGPVIAKDPDHWPFITLFPQAKGTWRGEANDRLVMAVLDEAKRRYSIDNNRVILAGLSYGGLGVWQIGARHTDVFAALLPVGGFEDLDSVPALKQTPVWAFHYTADPIVPVRNARDMCDTLQQMGGDVRLTEFPGMGHNAWDLVAQETDAVQWMLRQRKLSPYARSE